MSTDGWKIRQQKGQKATEWQYLLDFQNKIVIDILDAIFHGSEQNNYSESCVNQLIQSEKQIVCLVIKTMALYIDWFSWEARSLYFSQVTGAKYQSNNAEANLF